MKKKLLEFANSLDLEFANWLVGDQIGPQTVDKWMKMSLQIFQNLCNQDQEKMRERARER